MRKSGLIVGHLEMLSKDIFLEYKREIKQLFEGMSGIYILYKNHRLYYAGKASNIINRPLSHTSNKHKDNWNYISLYVVSNSKYVKELESFIIRIANLQLKGNSVVGKFSGSQNLNKQLQKIIRDQAIEKIAKMNYKHASSRVKKPRAERSLADLPFNKIYSFYKGKEYSGRITKAGTIHVRGKRYKSLSAAALSIVDSSTRNGWSFWYYYDEKNDEYRKLNTIRKKYGL